MKNLIAPEALTLDSMLCQHPDDYQLLEALADEQAGGYCKKLEFAGESTNKVTGQNELEWFVSLTTFTGDWDRDEDGYSRESQDVTESVTIPVTPHMTLGEIADALTKTIRKIENNVFA